MQHTLLLFVFALYNQHLAVETPRVLGFSFLMFWRLPKYFAGNSREESISTKIQKNPALWVFGDLKITEMYLLTTELSVFSWKSSSLHGKTLLFTKIVDLREKKRNIYFCCFSDYLSTPNEFENFLWWISCPSLDLNVGWRNIALTSSPHKVLTIFFWKAVG